MEHRRKYLIIFVLLYVGVPLATGSPCTTLEKHHVSETGGRCLWTSQNGGNFTNVISQCKKHGGHVFSFLSLSEMTSVMQALNQTDIGPVYIGAIWATDEQRYEWLSRPGVTPFLQDFNITFIGSNETDTCLTIEEGDLVVHNCSFTVNISICEREKTQECPCLTASSVLLGASATTDNFVNTSNNTNENITGDLTEINITSARHGGGFPMGDHVDTTPGYQLGNATNQNLGDPSQTGTMSGQRQSSAPDPAHTPHQVPTLPTSTVPNTSDNHRQGLSDLLLVPDPDRNGTTMMNFSNLLHVIAGRINKTEPDVSSTNDSHLIPDTHPIIQQISGMPPNMTSHQPKPLNPFPVTFPKFQVSGNIGQGTPNGFSLLMDQYSSTTHVVQQTSQTLKQLLATENVTQDTLQHLSGTVSSWQSSKTVVTAQMEEDVFSDIMQVTEKLVNNLGCDSVHMTTPTLDVFSDVIRVNSSYDQPRVDVTPTVKGDNTVSPKVHLSRAVFNNKRGVRVSTIIYKTIGPILRDPNLSAGSHVLSISVQYGDTKVKAKINMTNLVTFVLKTVVEKERQEKDRSCTYWDFDERIWSSKGCRVMSQNVSHTTCTCDHLTNFAVLVMYLENTEPLSLANQQALLTLTTVGCSLSIACLAMTIITYVYLRVLGNEKIMIHANLSLALVLAQIVFVSSSDAHHNEVACKTVAVLLHFLFMASFTWMLVEGIALYLYCTKGIFNQKDMRIKYFLLGWGLPLVIVVVSFAAQFPHYGDGPQFSCWLSVQNGLIWAFLGPMLAIILLNMFVLGLVVRVFLALKANSQKSEVARLRGSLRAMLTLLPLLGITWLLSLLVPFSVVFHYFFVITNTLQGMLIFFLHCLCNDEIRKKFHAKRRRWSSSARTGSDVDSSYTTRRKRGSFDAIKTTTGVVDAGRNPAWT